MLHSVALFEGRNREFAALAASETSTSTCDLDVLEWLLARTAGQRRHEIARTLLAEFQTLNDCLSAPPCSLFKAGLSPEMVSDIQSAWRLVGSVLASRFRERQILGSLKAVYEYLRINMADKPVEVLRVLFLYGNLRLLRDEIMQVGSVNHTPFIPREIAHRALNLGAASLLIAHNHPSGSDTPSLADIEMTRELKNALQPLGIRLHDHVIVGKNRTTSLAEMGLYTPGKDE